ncbi:MAG: hypothetical protein SFV21_05265 [Rhodospirillaceae bacterium]|nr:hypothetical protein [Rhodospirillaceae bacterium]
MSKSRINIVDEIGSFIAKHGNKPEQWYIGTAVSPKTQLFTVHGFTKRDVGLYREAGNDADAASVAGLFMGRGARGDKGVKPGAVYVYAYKMTSGTKPGYGGK